MGPLMTRKLTADPGVQSSSEEESSGSPPLYNSQNEEST